MTWCKNLNYLRPSPNAPSHLQIEAKLLRSSRRHRIQPRPMPPCTESYVKLLRGKSANSVYGLLTHTPNFSREAPNTADESSGSNEPPHHQPEAFLEMEHAARSTGIYQVSHLRLLNPTFRPRRRAWITQRS
jgi:hypothetical protein